MWKMVLDDLRCGLKPGLKKVLKHFINYYIYLYLLLLAPIILKLEGKYYLFYLFAILPVILAMLLVAMYGGRANKALYLCPLSKEQRRQYFLISWGVRAALPPLLALILEGALCISGQISFLSALLIVLATFFFSLPLNLRGGNIPEVGWAGKGFAYFSIWYTAVLLFGIFTIIFLSAIIGDVEEPRFTGGEIALTIILFFGLALVSLITLVKYFHLAMEEMVCYEYVREKTGGEGR